MGAKSKGKSLERKLKKTNIAYRLKKLAVIHYVEVPVIARGNKLILQQSIVDFIGAASPSGRGVAFDAKHTLSKTSFPFANIKDHQIEFLRYYHDVGADSFFIIQFSNIHGEDKAFKVPAQFVVQRWDDAKMNNGKKSIPVRDFDKEWLVDLDDYLNLL